jgi:hypothetical protein
MYIILKREKFGPEIRIKLKVSLTNEMFHCATEGQIVDKGEEFIHRNPHGVLIFGDEGK